MPEVDEDQLTPDELLLYDAYRAMGCPAAVDPVDPDDCASVAVESIRVLRAAGRLLPDGGETRTDWGVRSGDDYAIDCSDSDEAHRWAVRDVLILRGRGRDAALIRREIHRWPDGSSWTGPVGGGHRCHLTGVRGPCNLIGQGWGDGSYTEAECAQMLAEFEAGKLEVSQRNWVPIKFAPTATLGRVAVDPQPKED